MLPAPDCAADLIEKRHALATLDSSRGYLHYLKYVVVDAQPLKGVFNKVAEPWQWDREERVAPAIDHLCNITDPGSYTGPLSFWHGYHKGSDKTHAIARKLCFMLGWSKRRLNLVACAGDRDQAGLVTTAMIGILQDNPWIAERVEVSSKAAHGYSGSTLEVLPMDAFSGQGIFPDYIVSEELTHWKYQEGRNFWNFILSTVNKRPHCVLEVCTNAGHQGSWQWDERNRIQRSKFWSFYEAPVGPPLPTWMNQEKIDDDSQGMDDGERDRLYRNRWVDPGEERGYLTLEDAERCVDYSLREQVQGERGQEYFLVIDYGGVRDRCALAVMHTVKGTDRAVVDRLDCWQGSHENRIAINDDPSLPLSQKPRSVEAWIETTRKNFRVSTLVVDPNQLEGLAILYERKGLFRVERFEYRGGKANYRMAQLLKTTVQNRKISWSPWAGLLPPVLSRRGELIPPEDDTLAKELSKLVIKPMSYGYRFDHEAGRHDDRAVAVGMGLLHAFPETLPEGSTGPRTVFTEKSKNVGVVPKPKQDFVPQWGLWGIGGGGSAWDRGDLR